MDPDFAGDTNGNDDSKHSGSLFSSASDQFESVFDDIITTTGGGGSQPMLAAGAGLGTSSFLSPGGFHSSQNNLSVPGHHRSPSMYSDTSSAAALDAALSPSFHSAQASPLFYAQDPQQTTGLEQMTQNFTLLDEVSPVDAFAADLGPGTLPNTNPTFDLGFQFPEPSSSNSPATPDIGFPVPDIIASMSKSNESYDSQRNDAQQFMNVIPFPSSTSAQQQQQQPQQQHVHGSGFAATAAGSLFPNDESDFFSTASQASASSMDNGDDSMAFLSPAVQTHSNVSSPGRFRSHSDSSAKTPSIVLDSSHQAPGSKPSSLFLSPGSRSTSPVSPVVASSPLTGNDSLSPYAAANLSTSTVDSNGSASTSKNQLSVPGAEVRRARSTSTSSSRSRTSTSRSRSRSQTRDYLLELASPSQPNKRVQKHPSVYGCHLCDKRFTRAYNLRSHLRTHTDERPFVCTVCGKAFARQHDRKRHEALHSGEKKFECRGVLADGATQWGCGRKFARADALGRHFRTEAGKECIRPLIEEDEKLKPNQDGNGEVPIYLNNNNSTTPSLMLSPPESGTSSGGTSAFPSVLLQQFPSLGNLSWDNTGSELEDE